MDLMVRATSRQQSRPTADKRSLQRIGLLFAITTLMVIGAAGLTVRYQLGMPVDLTDRAGGPSAARSST